MDIFISVFLGLLGGGVHTNHSHDDSTHFPKPTDFDYLA